MNKRENIYSFKGFSKVCAFTATQTFKNSAYRLSLIIFVLVMTLMGPIQYIMGTNTENSVTAMTETNFDEAVTKMAVVVNATDIPLTPGDITEPYTHRAGFSGTMGEVFVVVTDGGSQLNAPTEDTAIIWIDSAVSGAGYTVHAVVADDTIIPPSEISNITDIVASAFDQARLKAANITENDIAVINSGLGNDGVMTYDDYKAEESKTVSSSSYLTYAIGFSVLVMIVISMSTNFIIASVTEEKQSKLVESLLVSVRPMALLMGKIAGMLSYVLAIVALGFVGSKLSDLIMKTVFKDAYTQRPVGGFNFDMFGQFGTKGFLIMVLALALGYITFAILGGVLGSACSKPEDTQSATGTVMLLVMMGYMGAIFGGIPDSATINLVLSLVPPFSYFTAPIMYVTGRIELWTFLVSLLLQILILLGLAVLCAKTYRNLILSDSSTPKLKAIFKFAK